LTQTYFTVEVDKTLIDELHLKLAIPIPSNFIETFPNQYLVLRDPVTKASSLGRITPENNGILRVVDTNKKRRFRVRPKNLEQTIVLDALLSDIPAITLTGVAGSGKTILCCGAATHLLDTGEIDRVIITRPMSTIGKYQLGYLPGAFEEKLEPYLLNYRNNFEQLMGHYEAMDSLLASGKVQMLPIQLMRGASFVRSMIIVDEAQVLTVEDIISIGTRTGEGSKIVFVGDLDQRDEPITKEETGLYKLANSKKAQQSPLIAQLSLSICVRSGLAAEFSSYFDSGEK